MADKQPVIRSILRGAGGSPPDPKFGFPILGTIFSDVWKLWPLLFQGLEFSVFLGCPSSDQRERVVKNFQTLETSVLPVSFGPLHICAGCAGFWIWHTGHLLLIGHSF